MEGAMAPLEVRGVARCFEDPDELAASMPNVAAGCPPLSGGITFTGGYRRLFLGPLLAQRVEMAAPTIVRGAALQHGLMGAVIPPEVTGTPGASINRERLRTGEVVLLTGRSEFAWRFDGALRWAGLVVEADALAALAPGRPAARPARRAR